VAQAPCSAQYGVWQSSVDMSNSDLTQRKKIKTDKELQSIEAKDMVDPRRGGDIKPDKNGK